MSVTQVSQIQVRRGALLDLGQLAAGEFGWAIDRLRLFIGNGTIAEGAPIEGITEILTTRSDLFELFSKYRFRGLLGGYEVLTGVNSLSYTYRTLQNKLDDNVNIRDFGAVGDGIIDDRIAIQRAIDQIYGRLSSVTPVITRRVINFHPGTYKIVGELRIPPYCVLRGAGKNSVIIEQADVTASCVFRTTDNTGAFGANILAGMSDTAKFIEMSDIVFSQSLDNTIAIIDAATDVTFNKCRFVGPTINPMTVTSSAGVKISSDYFDTRSIYFTECDFIGTSSGVDISDIENTSEITFDKCLFFSLMNGVTVSTTHTGNISSIKVMNSLFNQIGSQAILANVDVQGITSAFNTYSNVGDMYQGPGSAVSSIIEFNSDNNYSIADIFTRTQADNLIFPSVEHNGYSVMSTNISDAVRFGNSYQTVGKSVIVDSATTNYIPIHGKFKHGIINYSAERNLKYRTGTIKFVIDSGVSECHYHDSFTENASVGVDIDVMFNAGSPFIVCTSNNSSDQTVITLDVKSLVNS
jgi:hypothetical protein